MKKITIKILFSVLIFTSGVLSAQTLKFYEVFDSLNAESRGWRFINNDSSMTDYEPLHQPFTFTNTGLLNPKAGNYFIDYNSLNANENRVIDEWIISPQISTIEKYDQLSFWCGAVDKSYKDTLRVLISVTGNEISDFMEIDRFKVDGPEGAWHNKLYDLSAYAGRNIYFAVNYYLKDAGVLGKNSDNVWIDNFTVKSSFGPDIQVNQFDLEQNYPNPFNPSTNIIFSLPSDSRVEIKIFDVLGKLSEVLLNSDLSSGRYKIVWNASNFASGVYYYKITAVSGSSKFEDTKQMMLIR
ncbi:MAG: T9SS type A sorting domain-containing protein [Bacteroidetes bacterium]|nr:T9SS type A sorting domain-containing protein [Bacteroidota bacterium]